MLAISETTSKNELKRLRIISQIRSFGASPLRKEIGLGRAEMIEEIEIRWHPGGTQIFKNIRPNQFLRIHEGSNAIDKISLKAFNFNGDRLHNHAGMDTPLANLARD